MQLIKMDKARESAPVILSLVKDTGWCYAFGLVSIITIIPVLTFQVYEVWKARKEGTHKVMMSLMATCALLANGTWMVSDIYFHDRYRGFSRIIFAISFLFLGLYGWFAWRQAKRVKVQAPNRVMAVSREMRGIVFIHSHLSTLRKPSRQPRVLMARHRTHR